MEMEDCHELFKLTIEQFARTIELGIPLEALFILECTIQGTDPQKHIKDTKLAGLMQTLKRKGFLSEDHKPTSDGIDLYEDLRCGGMAKPKVIATKITPNTRSLFESWWNLFPATDGFEYMNKKFERTRILRSSKEKCWTAYVKCVNEGHSGDEINQATTHHVAMMKTQSIKTRANKLTFLQNSLTYLNQKTYESLIGEKGPKEGEITGLPVNTTIDI